MESIFITILNRGIAAGWLVLAVFAIRLLLAKAPKWTRCLLWALVAVRLACPFTLESVLSLIPSAEAVPQTVLHAGETVPYLGPEVTGSSVLHPGAVLNAALSGTVSHQEPQLFTILAILWLVGMAAMVLYAAVSYLRVYRRTEVHAENGENVWICDSIDTPFLIGVLRPRICMPASLAESDRPYVLAHEMAHIRRGDHWWKLIGYLLLAVYWFHPLLWLAYWCLCRDIECACDERVLREKGMNWKKPYAEVLLECSVSGREMLAVPLAFGEIAVKSRIKGILNYRKPAFWLTAAAIIACIVLAVCFLTDPGSDRPDVSGSSSSQEGASESVSENWNGGINWNQKTPQEIRDYYCSLDVSKGLDVYVSRFAEGSYSCMLAPTGSIQTSEDTIKLWSLPNIGVDAMKEVLASYEIEPEQIHFIPYQHPLSSYLWVIFEEGEDPEQKLAQMSEELRELFGY